MPYTDDQYKIEVQIARLRLTNTLRYNQNDDIVNKARLILSTPSMFEKFVQFRLEEKYGELYNKPQLHNGWFTFINTTINKLLRK